MPAGLVFEKKAKSQSTCDNRVVHKQLRSARYKALWMGWPVGDFCPQCRKEMLDILAEMGFEEESGP